MPITITDEQLKELTTYLGDQPAKFSNPILTFLGQLQAEKAKQEQESVDKTEPELDQKFRDSDITKEAREETRKTLKKVK